MIRRITLENYMSHTYTVIEPAAGLTVLVGPNNCGKSAVVSALETLCSNASGGYMVRHDEKEASVTIETDDGHTFAWRRRGNTVSYLIDSREISRLNRGVPEDLHRLLRLPKVDSGGTGEPFDIHFGTQKSPIFLLNESESRAAIFFASSSDAAILLEMQKLHRHKVKERKHDEERLQGEIARLDAELAALAPLDALADPVSQVEGAYQHLTELEGQIQTLRQEIEALREHTRRYDQLNQEYQCLAALKPPPQVDDVHQLASLSQSLSDKEEDYRKLKGKVHCLSPLNALPVIDDIYSLLKLVGDLQSAHETLHGVTGQLRVLERLTPPPDSVDTEPLAMLISQLDRVSREVAGHEALIRATAEDMAKVQAEMDAAEGVCVNPLLCGPRARRSPRHILMALGASAGMATVILLFVFGVRWWSRLNTESPDRPNNEGGPIVAAIAEAGDIGKRGSVSEIQQHPKTEPPREPPTQKSRKNEPDKLEPKKEEFRVARDLRLKQVRQLLNDAEMANQQGKYLEAILNFGQAAIFYQQELGEIENPEKVRVKFIDSLKHYQAEVERALQKAAEQRRGDRAPDTKEPGVPNSR
jgi:exonuclease SbcC